MNKVVDPTDDVLLATLEEGVAALGQSLTREQSEKMIAYLRLLAHWNRSFNLTAVRDIGEMLPRHLLDSLSIRPCLNGDAVVDIGSGAGLPGIPLAIAEPEKYVVLVDSAGKRCRFLTQAIVELGLDNVSVENQRVEDYRLSPDTGIGPGLPDGFPLMTARAYSSLQNLIGSAGHLLAENGKVLAMKGSVPGDEIAALPTGWQLAGTEALQVPGIVGERHLLVIERS